MNFCSNCGHPVNLKVPAGDTLPRHVCGNCGSIHYQNPKIIVGALAEWDDRVLMCRRAIEPRYGLWTLPAGFMECGEDSLQGALRETLEEAGARIEIQGLYSIINITYVDQIYLIYRARLLDLDFCAGEESLEVRLMQESEVPWGELAFRSIDLTLRAYFRDRPTRRFDLFEATLDRRHSAARLITPPAATD
ncbi:MAG: NUDIX hydrolase [Rhodocyclaceae bacterium]|nr:NUDIX hydrolase [Rhodocyclaceae bacterium]MBX3670599.1 NUDIX hydrolase [Rhodocyclaceae bacterium]